MGIVRFVVLMFLVSFQASTIWSKLHKKRENGWDMGTCPDMQAPRFKTGAALLIGIIGKRFDDCQNPQCLFIKEYDGTKLFRVCRYDGTIWGKRHKKKENEWDHMGTCPDMQSPRFRSGVTSFIDLMGERFDNCQCPQCLFIKEYDGTKLFRVCRYDGNEEAECTTDATTHTDNREPETGELEPYTRRTECSSTATKKPTGHAAISSICSNRYFTGLAIAIPVLAMILGAVAMAFVCVFIPQLHREATRRLNRKTLENRQSQMPTLIGAASPQQQDEGQYMEQLNRSALPSDDQMYSELDQQRNDIQSLERQTEGNGHLYMDMNGTQNIYNEEGYTLMHGNQTQTSNIAS